MKTAKLKLCKNRWYHIDGWWTRYRWKGGDLMYSSDTIFTRAYKPLKTQPYEQYTRAKERYPEIYK